MAILEKIMNNKGKKVIIFEHKEYQGYIPKTTGTIIEETENGVLVKTGWFSKKFVMKNKKDAGYYCGYIEFIE